MGHPDVAFSHTLNLKFVEHLRCSLHYLLDYWGSVLPSPVVRRARKQVDKLDESSNIWLASALNRRLKDLALTNRPGAVRMYVRELGLLSGMEVASRYIVSFQKLNRIQKALFSHLATDYSVVGKHIFEPVPSKDFEITHKLILEAFDFMKEALPSYYEECSEYVSAFLVFQSQVMSAGTTFDLAKLIFIQSFDSFDERNLLVVIDRILHETAHIHLHLQTMDDPLLLNSPHELYDSPFRDKPRPLIGIYHAHFVLYRLITGLSMPAVRERFTSDLVDPVLDSYKKAIYSTQQVLSENGKFTTLGQGMFESSKLVTETLVA